jgi:hypothetical protein
MAVFDMVKDYVRECTDKELEVLVKLVSEEATNREANRKIILKNNMLLAIKEYRKTYPEDEIWVGYYDTNYLAGKMNIDAGYIFDELIGME